MDGRDGVECGDLVSGLAGWPPVSDLEGEEVASLMLWIVLVSSKTVNSAVLWLEEIGRSVCMVCNRFLPADEGLRRCSEQQQENIMEIFTQKDFTYDISV